MSQRSEMQAEIDRLRTMLERVEAIAGRNDSIKPSEKVARIRMAIASLGETA